jgi:acetyl-CoA carboxylase carboxyltransferase component
VGVWHFVSDDADPWRLVRHYLDAVPSGSYLALSHVTADGQRPDRVQRFKDVYSAASENLHFRTHEQIDHLFDGLEFLPPYEGAEPGLSYVDVWGSKNPDEVDPAHTWLPAGVARKP